MEGTGQGWETRRIAWGFVVGGFGMSWDVNLGEKGIVGEKGVRAEELVGMANEEEERRGIPEVSCRERRLRGKGIEERWRMRGRERMVGRKGKRDGG